MNINFCIILHIKLRNGVLIFDGVILIIKYNILVYTYQHKMVKIDGHYIESHFNSSEFMSLYS